jgi:hypothetical protein
MSNQCASMTGVKAMGFQLKGANPADSTKLVTKGELNTYFYVDNVAAGISGFPDNRIVTYDELTKSIYALPVPPFYQYNVTRSSIPGATGAFFNYIAPDFSTQTILQNTYGFVGTFCMQENSYQNNQYNVYTISLVGVCYPNYSTYPQPYLVGNNLYFNNLGSFSVQDVKVYQEINVTAAENEAAAYLSFASGVTSGVLLAVGVISLPLGIVWVTVSSAFAIYAAQPNTDVTNQLRWLQNGGYTNGTLDMSTIKSSSGNSNFYIGYKVIDSGGGNPITFGYAVGNAAPPGITF